MRYKKEIIRQNVRIADVCYRYGINLNRQGYAHCPFHSGDNTPSFKIYEKTDSFFCFGCGVSGDAITLTMKIYNLSFNEAVSRLDMDFNLGLDRKPSFAEYKRLHKNNTIRNKQNIADIKHQDKLMNLIVEYIKHDINRVKYAPKTQEETPHRLFIEALHNIERVNYLIDCEEI